MASCQKPKGANYIEYQFAAMNPVSNLPAKVRMIPATKFVKGDHGDMRADNVFRSDPPPRGGRDRGAAYR